MAEIINLRQARKAKARSETADKAATNRALHGRTKAERTRDTLEKARLDKTLDQAKRED